MKFKLFLVVLLAGVFWFLIQFTENRDKQCKNAGGTWVATYGLSGLCVDPKDGHVILNWKESSK